MGKFRDLRGQKFGSLLAIECVGRDKFGNALWRCKCDCGNEYYGACGQLTGGGSLTCGRCPKNSYEIIGEIVIGKTSKGEEFIFNQSDYGILSKYNWFMQDGYVATNLSRKTIFMHNLLLAKRPDHLYVDHINRIRNDNRRINLRFATKSQNAINSSVNAVNTSGYKGVSYMPSKGKFRARIKFMGKEYHLGLFTCPKRAAEAYNQKAIELFGEYAFLNPIHERREFKFEKKVLELC